MGCDFDKHSPRSKAQNFNPRTPVGCDSVTFSGGLAITEFQSTHPSGVRLGLVGLDGLDDLISIHAPQWGATDRGRNHHPNSQISIHAPQWGATWVREQLRLGPPISIHAPQWGATWRPACTRTCNRFQSTHPSGVRPGYERASRVRRISIHAPQWGATSVALTRVVSFQFQSTHPSGVRPLSECSFRTTPYDFNPRTPVGCDCRLRQSTRGRRYFNPRTPVGCDIDRLRSPAGRRDFNPRTPVGCDKLVRNNINLFNKFQSTHPSGVRPFAHAERDEIVGISIHAPQWGATGYSGVSGSSPDLFQSTHPSGVRHSLRGA